MATSKAAERCIARTGQYFPADSGACSGQTLVCRGFYAHTNTGDLNGYLCSQHKNWWLIHGAHGKSYLTRRLMEFILPGWGSAAPCDAGRGE